MATAEPVTSANVPQREVAPPHHKYRKGFRNVVRAAATRQGIGALQFGHDRPQSRSRWGYS